jgi:hypothetical protein
MMRKAWNVPDFCNFRWKSLAIFRPIGILMMIMNGMGTIRIHPNGLIGRLALLLRR